MTKPADLAPKKRFKILSLEFLVVLYAMFLITSSVDLLLFADPGSAAAQETNPIRHILLAPLYLYWITYLFRHPSALVPVFKQGAVLVMILGLSLISVLWSIEPETTLRRSILFLFGTSFGFYLAARYTPEEFCRLMGLCAIFVGLFTALTVVVAPSLAIHHDSHYPALRGFFPHKNSLGPVMVTNTLLGIVLMFSSRDRTLGKFVFGISVALAVLSLSRTAWLNIIFVSAAFASILFMRKNKAAGTFLLFGVGSLSVSLIGIMGFGRVFTKLAGLMGRSTDLTDRGQIWSTLIDEVSRSHLWLGFGYDAFWDSFKGALSLDWGMEAFIPPHAHNGWLQCFSHLGLIGLVLMAIFVGQSLVRNYKAARGGSDTYVAFGLCYLIFFLSENITEVFLMARGSSIWIFFVYWSIASLNPVKPALRQPLIKPRFAPVSSNTDLP